MMQMKNTPTENGSALLYGELVAALRSDKIEHDPLTFAYARVSAEDILLLAETGTISTPSIEKDNFEYKCAFPDSEESMDDPLRPNDLAVARGSTKYRFVVAALEKLGLSIEELERFNDRAKSELVRYLDDKVASQEDFKRGHKSFYNVFISLALQKGISMDDLNELFYKAECRTGALIGLSSDFLSKAGEDSKAGKNYPCRYSNVFPQIEDITKIIPLDYEAKNIMDSLGNISSGHVSKDITGAKKEVRDKVEELEID